MRKKRFTYGTTFFTTEEMYLAIRRTSDELEIGVSDFIRGLIEEYFSEKAQINETNAVGEKTI